MNNEGQEVCHIERGDIIILGRPLKIIEKPKKILDGDN